MGRLGQAGPPLFSKNLKRTIMKTASRFFVPLALAIFFLASSMPLFSQKITIWKGGTPGMETNWDCHKNWSTYSVPDGFSDVIIPDVSTTTFAAPVIRSGQAEVNSLTFTSNTVMTVGKGAQLVVHQSTGPLPVENLKLDGILLFHDEIQGAKLKKATPVAAGRH